MQNPTEHATNATVVYDCQKLCFVITEWHPVHQKNAFLNKQYQRARWPQSRKRNPQVFQEFPEPQTYFCKKLKKVIVIIVIWKAYKLPQQTSEW